ncbi:glycosyltransferase [Acidithiobacillus ferrooxidans]|nr:glycosyltransferase [Acidithiobacillus ferrooxidans]
MEDNNMRIVIDLQGVQNESRNRGIGRYSLSIAKALSRQRGEHEVLIALNGAFSGTIDLIRREFSGLLPTENIKIWYPLTPVWSLDQANSWRRDVSELLYEKFLETLKPDIVMICSHFEGVVDNTVTSIHRYGKEYPVAVVLYDLIPLVEIHENRGAWSGDMLNWYLNKLQGIRQADLLLAISESSRNEAIEHVFFPPDRIVNISAAAEDSFRPLQLSDQETHQLRARYGISKLFIMSAAVVEPRKNLMGLIHGYAFLPKELRSNYQLVLVGQLNILYAEKLWKACERSGLTHDDVVFTGYVTDKDLCALYNLCDIFVFPSFHEGFGLPALEAMSCGAPTLAGNTTSLPEVIEWDAAMFDPLDVRDIAQHIEQALTNRAFREQLRAHGLQQAQKFSWDASARRALQAMEDLISAAKYTQIAVQPLDELARNRPRLAYVSPLPAAKSGIADYSAELLPELARHYDIDLIVEQDEAVTAPWVLANSRQRSVAWFEQHSQDYDRILYHFGNSHFHQHMFGLLERHPGMVVLHDFFLSGVIAWVLEGVDPGIWVRTLRRAHGWNALVDRYTMKDPVEVSYKYPCNWDVVQRAFGLIVHSHHSRHLAEQWYALNNATNWAQIPLLRAPVADVESKRKVARIELGLDNDDFLICSFGLLSQSKLNHRLLEAWKLSRLAREKRCRLVFIGDFPATEYGEELRQTLEMPGFKGRVHVTGWATEETYRRYLAAADLAVQLRTLSRGETSAAVLDCMNYGVATIVNANGSLADLPSDCVHMLSDNFETEELVRAIEALWHNATTRRAIGMRAAEYIRNHHNPRLCADQYVQFIEETYRHTEHGSAGLIKSIQRLGPPQDPQDLGKVAEKIAQIYPPCQPAKQLFVDISELVHRDGKTGIERVSKNFLRQLLKQPPEGFRVEPVYATQEIGYRYAHHFTAQFLGIPPDGLTDEPIEAYAGDVFFGMDWQPVVVPIHREWLQELRHRGISVYFLLYDILPVTLPEGTTRAVSMHHFAWLQTISQMDGVVCISRTVADEFVRWLDLFGPDRALPLQIGWSHIGANFTHGMIRDTSALAQHAALLRRLSKAPSFLMVGTVEPRKGHAQVLAAFDLLWRQDIHANLVIVGKQGWMVDELARHIRCHPRREQHLFWLENISDDLLEQIYATSTCLIAASIDEGFGLPLIEAAQHKLPILARDIAVFREVAGEHASYFSGDAPRHLAEIINSWLQAYQADSLPRSERIPWLTWEQSTKKLLDVMLGENWYRQWVTQADPQLVARYWGSDPRLGSVVGEVRGITCQSRGEPGNLLHGPYISLKSGAYVAIIRGACGFGGPAGAKADVTAKGGTTKLAEATVAWDETKIERPLAILPFILEEACTDLEVRMNIEEESDVQVSMVEILKQNMTAQFPSKPEAEFNNTLGEESSATFADEYRYWATHPRLRTQVGQKVGRTLWTQGTAGYLLHGPYIGLPAGTYHAMVFGQINRRDGLGGAWMDIAIEKGEMRLAKSPLVWDTCRSGLLGEVTFTVNGYTEDVEARVWVSASSELQVRGIQIEPVPDATAITNPMEEARQGNFAELTLESQGETVALVADIAAAIRESLSAAGASIVENQQATARDIEIGNLMEDTRGRRQTGPSSLSAKIDPGAAEARQIESAKGVNDEPHQANVARLSAATLRERRHKEPHSATHVRAAQRAGRKDNKKTIYAAPAGDQILYVTNNETPPDIKKIVANKKRNVVTKRCTTRITKSKKNGN